MIRVGSSEDHGLALDAIQIDGGTQSRATLNQHVVDDYAEAIKAGATFPPIVVFYDGKKHWLADGFHRFHAYQKAGKAKVAADVRQGTRRDAILFSVGANETHGLRRTRDDKRRAVLTLLNDPEWSKWSDREIARQCAVSPDTVGRVRKEVEPVTVQSDSEDRTYTTKHGTTATMKTAGINASRTQFQAKASEDNGSITGGAGAVTGEASRLASGRTDAGEAASVGLPTISDAVGDTDAIRAGHITRYHVLQLRSAWTKANAEARSIFLAETNLDFIAAPVVAAEATGNDLREPTAAASGQIIREGDAPRETDCQAGEQSQGGGDASSPDTEFQSDGDAISEVKGTARPENAAGVEPSSSDNPSAAPTAEPEATPSPPPASGTNSNPQPTSSPVTADKAEGSTSSPSASAANPKPFCLKLKDGHCKIAFETAALCAQCNAAKARAAA